jgi:hypothetical protein
MLTGKPTGNRSLGRPGRRWEENVKCILRKRYQYEELT